MNKLHFLNRYDKFVNVGMIFSIILSIFGGIIDNNSLSFTSITITVVLVIYNIGNFAIWYLYNKKVDKLLIEIRDDIDNSMSQKIKDLKKEDYE